MTHALVVGESLVDVLRTPVTGGSELLEARRPGGSPANVAVALARLGVTTTLMTCFADDLDGDLLAAHFKDAGVDVVRPSPVAKTSTAVARLDDLGQAAYDIDLCWDIRGAADVPLARPAVLHVGSLAVTESPGCEDVLALVHSAHQRREALVTYDLNCRPDVMGRPERVLPAMERLVALADVVKLSDEDAAWLYGDRDPFARLHDLGAPMVVLTRGAQGCVASTGTERIVVPASPGGPVVDTVGAGDAFMAGLIAQLRPCQGAQGDPRTALEFASLVARRTCERVGADPPLLTDLRP